MKPINSISARLKVSTEEGLSDAQVLESRKDHGSNALTPVPRDPAWRQLLSKFNDPMIQILLVAAAVSIAISLSSDQGHLFDGAGILIAVAIATGVSFLSEYSSDRELDLLNAQRRSARATVVRNGNVISISSEEIVVGDCVLLEAGDELPADGRLLRAVGLCVDQSLMTGESEAVSKVASHPDDEECDLGSKGCAFRGTQVVEGTGAMLVAAVGDSSMLGRIARSLTAGDLGDDGDGAADAPDDKQRVKEKLFVARRQTPLQQKLAGLANTISRVGYVMSGLIFGALMLKGWLGGELTGLDLPTLHRVLGYFIVAVVVIVVAVPEGLPMSVTISLALAMRKMTKANCLVRQLLACETIGSATVICSDKTGTITKNAMQVQSIATGHGGFRPARSVRPRLGGSHQGGDRLAADYLAANAVLNSTAHLDVQGGTPKALGNKTEAATLSWLHELGVDYMPMRARSTVVYQEPFSSERKRMSTVVREAPGELVLFTKGAPEKVLALCDRCTLDDGSVAPLDAASLARIRAEINLASEDAMRVLAFAHRPLSGSPEDEAALSLGGDELHRGMILDGLVAMVDPIREDVGSAIDRCAAAGIQVKMITGDNVETARAVGRQIGLLSVSDALVLTSDDLLRMSDEELSAGLPRLRILARATPMDKLRLVRLLQARGEVVAVTGDGTNDAPALKRADVGLAMGSGTAVAKEAAKIVLLDDAFSTIVRAVEWGRALYENIQRFLQFQLTINVAALVLAFVGPLLKGWTGIATPLSAIQLLWINVIMDTLAALALCAEPPQAGVLSRPPRGRSESIVTRSMAYTIFTTAGFYVAVMLGMLLLSNSAQAQPFPTIFFTTFVCLQVWNLINCRSLEPQQAAIPGFWQNRGLVAVGVAILSVQALIVHFGGSVFNTVPLGPPTWFGIVGVTAIVLAFGEITRRARLRAIASRAPAIRAAVA